MTCCYAAHTKPTQLRAPGKINTRTTRTKRYCPAPDGTLARMTVLAHGSPHAGQTGWQHLMHPRSPAMTDRLLTGRFQVRVLAREPSPREVCGPLTCIVITSSTVMRAAMENYNPTPGIGAASGSHLVLRRRQWADRAGVRQGRAGGMHRTERGPPVLCPVGHWRVLALGLGLAGRSLQQTVRFAAVNIRVTSG
jgi:hypothetical protein